VISLPRFLTKPQYIIWEFSGYLAAIIWL